MTPQQVLVQALKMDQSVWFMLLEDLSDADLLVRPVPGANHVAWQLGHILAAECQFLKEIGKVMPDLPNNFDQQHNKEMSQVDSTKEFLSKDEYMKHFAAVRAASIAACSGATDAELEQPNTGRMAKVAPTIADLFSLVAAHSTMHTGQLTVLRRKLGKPVKF